MAQTEHAQALGHGRGGGQGLARGGGRGAGWPHAGAAGARGQAPNVSRAWQLAPQRAGVAQAPALHRGLSKIFEMSKVF